MRLRQGLCWAVMYLVMNLMSSIKGGDFLIDLSSRRSVFLLSSYFLLWIFKVIGFSVIFSWLLFLGGRGILERWMLVVIDVDYFMWPVKVWILTYLCNVVVAAKPQSHCGFCWSNSGWGWQGIPAAKWYGTYETVSCVEVYFGFSSASALVIGVIL